MRCKLQIAGVVVSVFIAWIAVVDGAEQPPAGKQAKLKTTELIRRLGDGSFVNRESAKNELLRRGHGIKGELVAALKYPDLEVRFRVREILSHIAEADFKNRVAAFIADVEGKQKHDLPGWKRYRELVGSDRSARELFAEMLKEEIELLQEMELKPRNVAAIFAARMQNPNINRGNPPLSQVSIATLLFIGSDPKLSIDTTTLHRMYSFLSSTTRVKAVIQGPRSDLLKKLVISWIQRGAGSTLSSQFIMIAMRHDLGEANIEIGRRLLKMNNLYPTGIPYAILTVGKYGNKEDLALLEPLLKRTTVCYSWSRGGNPRITIEVQIRDVALVTMVHLTGQNTRDYGFDILQKNSQTLFSVNTLGFSDNNKRNAAHEKWRVWLEKQPKKKPQ